MQSLVSSKENPVLDFLIQSSYDAIIGVDQDGLIVSWNPAATKIYGYVAEEALGRPSSMLSPPGLEHEARELHARCRRGELIEGYETVRIRKNDTPVRVSLTLSPIFDDDGACVGTFAIHRNISRRLLLLDRMQRLRLEADDATRVRDQFLGVMSHELRTPMNGILGFCSLLESTQMTEEQAEYLGMVRTSAHGLMKLLGDILDLCSLQAGQLALEHFDLRPSDLVADVVGSFRTRARARDVRLGTVLSPSVPKVLVGDASRLKQVLGNLLDNALKFTPSGEVTVHVDGDASESCFHLHVAVTDTGIGIPLEQQARIFGRFAMVDATMRRTRGGTGLGLTVASELVELMRGRIWLESEPGQGSTFHVTVPLDLPHGEARTRRSLHILLAEDNPVNAMQETAVLRRHGHRCTLATSGIEVLATLEVESIDLILMDVNMPHLDGLHTTALIRARESDGDRHLPIVAVSPPAGEDDRTRYLQAGMDDYLPKPLQPRDAIQCVERLCGRSSAGTPAEVGDEEGSDVFRPAAALALAGGNADVLRRMAALFLEQAPHSLADIRSCLRPGDPGALERGVHDLRGSLLSLAAYDTCEAAMRLEVMGHRGRLSGGDAALAVLEAEMDRLSEALRHFLENG